MNVGLFEPRRPKEAKGRGGKALVGVWATQDEQQLVKALASDRGYTSVADYFRSLIREDLDRNGTPER